MTSCPFLCAYAGMAASGDINCTVRAEFVRHYPNAPSAALCALCARWLARNRIGYTMPLVWFEPNSDGAVMLEIAFGWFTSFDESQARDPFSGRARR